MSSLKSVVNRHFRGREPWQIVLETLLAAGATYVAALARAVVRERGLSESLLALIRSAPLIGGVVQKELNKSKADVEKMTLSCKEVQRYPVNQELPAVGVSREALLKELVEWKAVEHGRYSDGQASGTVYHGGEELNAFLGEVYTLFLVSNPLHPGTFPFVQKMEAEVVAMTLKMFRGDTEDHCGVTTSGGTESICMAMKAYREFGRARGIRQPEIVACVTAHASFDKAADYFGMKLVHVPCDPRTFCLDFQAAKRAITANTVVVVCSAPSYPQGVIDPVGPLAEHLKELQRSRGWDIGLHVDSCLGGFLAPFVRQLDGHSLPPFDFSVRGVTSISADTHKYGFSPKGTSVLMYATRELRQCQYFTAPKWTGGIYATPTMAGSRSGGVIAATWAVMMHMGLAGYLEASREIVETARTIKQGVAGIDGLEVMGDPLLSVVAFRSTDPQLNIYAVSAAMGHHGGHQWDLNALQNPASIHICVTYLHKGLGDKFVRDLRESVRDVRERREAYAKNSSVAIYGTTQVVPASLTAEISKAFLDALYKVPDV